MQNYTIYCITLRTKYDIFKNNNYLRTKYATNLRENDFDLCVALSAEIQY